MKMTKDDVIKKLKDNVHYKDFLDEYHGKFVMNFEISNIPIVIFNSVGGYIEGYFMMTYEMCKFCEQHYPEDIECARGFIEIAIPYLREELKKREAK